MTVLLRAAELVKRPVVTLAGKDVAQIKDVIYASADGELAGFTLNGRGMFSGPMRKTLPWQSVHGLGPDAVMITDEDKLADRKALSGEREGAGGGVLGSRVLTAGGRELGVVTDLILAVNEGATDAVGYEISPSDDAAPRRQFVPLPDTMAVSGEALIVPDAATEFIRDDLAGFGAAVDEFRERLRAGAPAGSTITATPPVGIPMPTLLDDEPPFVDDAPPREDDVPAANGSAKPPLPGADPDPPVLPPEADEPGRENR
jgi:uncharacterized protein YrrD